MVQLIDQQRVATVSCRSVGATTGVPSLLPATSAVYSRLPTVQYTLHYEDVRALLTTCARLVPDQEAPGCMLCCQCSRCCLSTRTGAEPDAPRSSRADQSCSISEWYADHSGHHIQQRPGWQQEVRVGVQQVGHDPAAEAIAQQLPGMWRLPEVSGQAIPAGRDGGEPCRRLIRTRWARLRSAHH